MKRVNRAGPGRRRILYFQYTNPAAYPPLEHSTRILADAGWDVSVLGTGAAGSNALAFPPHPRIRVRRMSFKAGGWLQKFHYVRFCLWVIRAVIRWDPDWVYASDLLSCPAGLILARFLRRRLVYHEHDSPSGENGSAGHRTLFQRVLLRCRRQLAGHARLCVLPNHVRADVFRRGCDSNGRVVIVWNCPRLEEVVGPRQVPHNRELRLYYHGSLSPQRLPLSVVDAMAQLPDRIKLYVLGYETIGHQGYSKRLGDAARRSNVEDRLRILKPMPRRDALQVARRCDVGLILMPRQGGDLNMREMVGASNKAFDYLACGMPLLVSDLPEWRRTFTDPGFGLACDPDDPRSIARALRWFLDHPSEMRRMGERGRERVASEWNYETQFEKVRRILETGAVQPSFI